MYGLSTQSDVGADGVELTRPSIDVSSILTL